MISPELFRRYPFFAFLNHEQLRELAMITNEVNVPADSKLFEMDEPADFLYLLMEGSIDLHYVVVDEHEPELRKDFLVGTISPGELVGISALAQPHSMTATAEVTEPSTLLKIDATALRELINTDTELANDLQRAALKATKQRLHATRILLAAATATD